MAATPQQLNERRVKDAYRRYRKARDDLNAHVEAHKEAFEVAYELSDTVNTARKRLDKTCRETATGVGPVTVTVSKTPVYDVDYVEGLFKDRPLILGELITITKKVQRKVFEGLVIDGELTKAQAKAAVTEVRESPRITGMPDEIVLP
jgi:hypothetical protein